MSKSMNLITNKI